MENQISVKSFGYFRIEISGSNISLTSGSVTGGTRLGRIKLSGQKKLFVMSKGDSFQVVTKHVIVYL